MPSGLTSQHPSPHVEWEWTEGAINERCWMPARRTFPTIPGSTLTTGATPRPLSGGT